MLIWPVSVQSSRPRRTIISDVNDIHGKLLNEHKQLESRGEVLSQALCKALWGNLCGPHGIPTPTGEAELPEEL